MNNATLKLIDGDLVFDADGMLVIVEGDETTAQNIQTVLRTWKGDFELVPDHGADYDKVFDADVSDLSFAPEDVVRAAIYQEDDVKSIESLTVTEDTERHLAIAFTGTLTDGSTVTTEVTTDG
ncbi:MAG: hypothetical protein ACRDBO_10795 [Lachnospiraceae bacterium]